uniref:Secreted protein n=1 Tax=Caenorhabditis tropicalis TaxID=1561998 RepID=A0A1I7V2V0_9PELO
MKFFALLCKLALVFGLFPAVIFAQWADLDVKLYDEANDTGIAIDAVFERVTEKPHVFRHRRHFKYFH